MATENVWHGHITVVELQKLLTTLPPDARIAPSVGTWALMVWDAADENIIGEIHKVGERFEVHLYAEDDR